ncbi:MAG: hypothetical protein GDA43_17970 [Hormoscilla sp. SP5CHS1]|nr:hypothetical protein [Hormoscilla sp. SP5CHS1]
MILILGFLRRFLDFCILLSLEAPLDEVFFSRDGFSHSCRIITQFRPGNDRNPWGIYELFSGVIELFQGINQLLPK